MNPPPADSTTAALVRACLDRCARNGGDPVRALDREGLLHHPKLVTWMEQRLLERVAGVLREMTVAQIAAPQRVPATALDMKNAVVQLIEGWAQKGNVDD